MPEGLVGWGWCTGSHASTDDENAALGREAVWAWRREWRFGGVGWGVGVCVCVCVGGGGYFRGRFCPVLFVGSFGLAVERVN